MKKIICFGDSNTFGFNPKNGERYCADSRWTGILSKLLEETCQVIEDGCNNRTGFCKNPDGLLQTGAEYLPHLLEKHDSFDIFILALGTNDLQTGFKIDENIAKNGLKNLTALIRKTCPKTQIILIPPVVLPKSVINGPFSHQFDDISVKSSYWIQSIYNTFAQEETCALLDVNHIVKPSELDGLHYDKDSHKAIAKFLASHILG